MDGREERRRPRSPVHEAGDKVLSWAEDGVYAVVAVILVTGAAALIGNAIVTFVKHAKDGLVVASTELLSVLLLVFVFVELLAAVRLTLRERQLLAEPFLLVGIIASIKEIVVVAGAERPAEHGFEEFRNGTLKTLVLSKVGNFSIDLPEAAVAIQVSGTFGSRQEEAQRLGRVLRPKADGRQAHFYTVVSRDTIDTEYAAHRQRFLAEQGYAYTIVDADDVLS